MMFIQFAVFDLGSTIFSTIKTRNNKILDRLNTASFFFHSVRNKICYAVKRNGGVWQYTWNESDWESSMLSRYYGSARDICALYERHSTLCAITKSGVIWAINKPRLQFKKLFYLSIPQQVPIDLELGFLPFACSVVLGKLVFILLYRNRYYDIFGKKIFISYNA